MVESTFGDEFPIRGDIVEAVAKAWERLGHVGPWLDGKTRLAVASEVRNARSCALCVRAKEALSPYALQGQHDSLTDLPPVWIDVIHRITTDSGRLTQKWLREALGGGLAEEEFIEIVSVTVQVIVIDALRFGVGVAPLALPDASAGQAARQADLTASPGPGWISTIAPGDAAADFADFYANESYFYIRRSLTALPDECRGLWDLLNVLYVPDPRVHEIEGLDRSISRAQIEFLAARSSALLNCYY
jgi:hypothetical protein